MIGQWVHFFGFTGECLFYLGEIEWLAKRSNFYPEKCPVKLGVFINPR
jgi:hypothetical protein